MVFGAAECAGSVYDGAGMRLIGNVAQGHQRELLVSGGRSLFGGVWGINHIYTLHVLVYTLCGVAGGLPFLPDCDQSDYRGIDEVEETGLYEILLAI